MTETGPVWALGAMSGTSLDGVDAAMVLTDGRTISAFGEAGYRTYSDAEQATIRAAFGATRDPARDEAAAEVVETAHAAVLSRIAGADLVGFHGQTLWHDPDNGVTLQAGDGSILAEVLGLPVVWDFRTMDVMMGGQGAPLAPLLHRVLFHSDKENRAILNLGGIANLTILPATGGIAGYDCGPGNCLLDGWIKRQMQKDYDDDGRWAAKGEVDTGLLSRMLADPYFRLPPPKSTGLEYFNLSWLDKKLGQTPATAINVQTTLT